MRACNVRGACSAGLSLGQLPAGSLGHAQGGLQRYGGKIGTCMPASGAEVPYNAFSEGQLPAALRVEQGPSKWKSLLQTITASMLVLIVQTGAAARYLMAASQRLRA